MYSIGKSVEGRKLQVIELSRKNSKSKPNVKMIAGVHGDEPLGTQLLLNLVQHLVENFERDKSIRYFQDFRAHCFIFLGFLNHSNLHILFSPNVDNTFLSEYFQRDKESKLNKPIQM
jgi:hypothetical protein